MRNDTCVLCCPIYIGEVARQSVRRTAPRCHDWATAYVLAATYYYSQAPHYSTQQEINEASNAHERLCCELDDQKRSDNFKRLLTRALPK
eukprot:973112-Pleurochrysis_carterae.AAC.2